MPAHPADRDCLAARDAAALDWLDRLLDCDVPSRTDHLASLGAEDPALQAKVRRLLRVSRDASATRALALPLGWLTERRTDATPDARTARWSPGERMGRWTLQRELGRGGMAAVWLACDLADPKQSAVALKLPLSAAYDDHPAAAHTVAAAMAVERDALALLRHPNVVQMIEFGTCRQGRPWLALALVDGVSIDRHCREAALPLAGRLALLRELLAALGHAHAHGVVHRDVKPLNVLVDRAQGVRLIDFGIAACGATDEGGAARPLPWRTGAPGRADPARRLTPRYAAPEQRRGEAGSAASDIYAAGLLLYELATGQPPSCTGHNAASAAAPRPSEAAIEPGHARRMGHATVDGLRAELRARADGPVLRALQADPAGRYRSAAEFAAALALRC